MHQDKMTIFGSFNINLNDVRTVFNSPKNRGNRIFRSIAPLTTVRSNPRCWYRL